MQECEGFMAKGISGSGAGFDAPSMGRLGGRGPVPTHNPPARQLKSIALKVSQLSRNSSSHPALKLLSALLMLSPALNGWLKQTKVNIMVMHRAVCISLRCFMRHLHAKAGLFTILDRSRWYT